MKLPEVIYWDKSNDTSLPLFYSWCKFQNWEILLAQSSIGLCFSGFKNKETNAFELLQKTFPKNELIEENTEFHQIVISHLKKNNWEKIPLHVKGTDFQIKIWEELLKIPAGKIKNYQDLHPNPNYARAVGSAVGSNPISILIPCHRVTNKSGKWTQYLWGPSIKKALLERENVYLDKK